MANAELILNPIDRASLAIEELHAFVHGALTLIEVEMEANTAPAESLKVLLLEAWNRNALVRNALDDLQPKARLATSGAETRQ